MPRLCAARFESVGHRDARPADSVLWLHNGGGKSSILNILFSVLRPSQREFLGSEADAGVASWGGLPFLRVKVRVPPTAPERHAIAEALIERVVQQRDVPSGLRLVQAMMRELVRGGGLAVRVL
jgi:hypothetical protein